SVKITADVADITAKFAVARAEAAALTAEMNKLARATAAGTIDPAGSARLNAAAGAMLQAKQRADELAQALGRTHQVAGGVSGAAPPKSCSRAGERMIGERQKAREGSGSAVNTLRQLGVTLEQIHDPAFSLNDLFQLLHERLTNAATSQATMATLLSQLGPRY